jgi:hypothetical protein
MAGIEIREYHGDYADLAEFGRRVWIDEYGGKTWIPIPDPAFMRWRVSPESGGRTLVAYQGTKLVGTVFSFPQSLRIGDSVFPVAICTGFSVDPEYRGAALPLIQRLRSDIEERGFAFGIGTVLDDPASASFRFWTKYATTFPQKFKFVFTTGYWAKFLGTRALARAGIGAWERMANRVFGPVLRFTPFKYDPRVRPYRSADLQRCAQMLARTTAGFDWAMDWQPAPLAAQLGASVFHTLVFERDGEVKGMVNCHAAAMHGRETVNAVFLDLWAEDGLSGAERVRLLSHLCRYLMDRDIHALVAPRSTMMPTAAFLANLFIPAPQRFHIGAFPASQSAPLTPPARWDLTIM